MILKIAYGYTIEPHERDPLIHMANLALERFSIAGTPGAWLVDMMPIREFILVVFIECALVTILIAVKFIPAWFPGAGFKHKAQMWKKNLEDVADRPYKFVQKCMESGRYEASYLSNLFKANGCPSPGSEEETIAKWTSASLYTGGADTVLSSLPGLNSDKAMSYANLATFIDRECDRNVFLGHGSIPRYTKESAS